VPTTTNNNRYSDWRDTAYSNFGNDVIYAPGSNVYSAAHTGDNLYKRLSGTSMAAPLVSE
jgi:subtilisin family serine protease